MKKLLLLALVTLSINARAQWVAQNSGTTNLLVSINFPSTNVGYALAQTGYLRKTINGGTNWNIVGGANDMYTEVYFTSIDTGFATGASGVLKTSDGGVTWMDNFPDAVNYCYVSFPTANIGYLVGFNNALFDTIFTYKTINAGITWTKISSLYSALAAGGIASISFINVNTGFLLIYGDALYKTTDGGLTWVPKSAVSDLHIVQFPSTSIGYAVGDAEIIKSIDGGETWNTLPNTNPQPLYSVFFTSNTTGYIAGGNGFNSGAIEKTIDGGATWTVDLSNVQTFYSIYFPNTNTGYACGTNGVIYKLNTTVGVDEAKQDDGIRIYPNPATTQLEINNSGLVIKEVKIYNVVGEAILSFDKLRMTQNGSVTLDVSGFAKGIYFIEVTSTGSPTNIIRKKFVKE